MMESFFKDLRQSLRMFWQGRRFTAAAVSALALGIGAAFVLSRFVETFLFRVQARDPMVFIVMPMVLAAVAFRAVWFPARRASRIDPIIALRAE